MKNGNYYVGLDVGTGSVGWAVTDEAYHVIKKHGKALWGVRLFESANTAEERRGFRTARRRTQRRKERGELLQELFSDQMMQADPGFFLRMKESKYYPEDKRLADGTTPALPYALFADQNYTDVDFYKEYPTIYHLRKELIDSKEPHDVRLVYLALHHIIKHRGHFLFEGKSFSTIQKFETAFEKFCEVAEEVGIELENMKEYSQEIQNVLQQNGIGTNGKKAELIHILGVKSKQLKAVCTLLSGGTVKLDELFAEENYKNVEKNKVCFAVNAYEENESEYEAVLQEKYVFLVAAKAVYDWTVLSKILGIHKFLSEAKVEVYEKHKSDLAILKSLLKGNKDLFQNMFGVPKKDEANYSAYIGMVKKNGVKQVVDKNCSKESFYLFVKKTLEKIPSCQQVDDILRDIDAGNYMPKQVSKDNGVIPYQIHEKELNIILENAETYLPFLKEKDENGFSVADKIKAIFRYRIPYYVGPLNTSDKGNTCVAWAVRKNDKIGKILPWNFQEMIDEEKSAENFIRRMTNKCTYLIGKDVVPKESLLYSKFMVLNELNNLRIDEEKIPVSLKQQIYRDLFQRYRKVTGKKLQDYLLKEGIISKSQSITGFDQNFKASLKSYLDFKELGLHTILSESDMERIIMDITLFSDAKPMLKKRLKKGFPILTDKQISFLVERRYAGWGTLSRDFLCEMKAANPEDGEIVSIMDMLWNSNDNLMQLLGKKYNFVQAIEDENSQFADDEHVTYETVKEMYLSPSVKRPVWQTLKIMQELMKIMGAAPKRIFLEVAREKTDAKRSISRKQQLQELYAACKREEPQWMEMLATEDDNKLRSDRLFLYYIQKGRCMYSGEAIDLESLYDENMYDVDHIYPQSKVMDDSLNNRVLVKRKLNAEKSDTYPLSKMIRQSQKPFWDMLKKQGFLTQEKYDRLVRNTAFDTDELSGFIARQLVETRQSTKAVAELLKKSYPGTEVVYSKANVVSQFRQDFDMIKVRDVNDYHHAKDAYLNIVVGNTYYVKFTKDAAWFVRNTPGARYNLKKIFKAEKVERGGEVAWEPGGNGTICIVRQMMSKNNILFTRKSYEASGGLFDQQLMKKGKGQVPIKNNGDGRLTIEKYGGYNKAKGAYFMLVESEGKKGVLKRTLETVPLYLKNKLEGDNNALLDYCIQECGLKNPRIVIPKINIDSLFSIKGFRMHLSGRQVNSLIFKNANQLVLPQEDALVIKKIVKFCERKKINKSHTLSERDNLTAAELIRIYDVLKNKLENTVYKVKMSAAALEVGKNRDAFCSLEREDMCKQIAEILHLFQCNSSLCNFGLVHGPGNSGKVSIVKNISNYEDLLLITQSVTGFYENVIDLKAV